MNVDIKIGNMQYSDTEANIKINVKIQGAKSQGAKTLETYMQINNLTKIKGKCELVEYRSRNRKYPFIFKENTKRYKCSKSQAKIYFGV